MAIEKQCLSATVVPASVLEELRQRRAWIALAWADEDFRQVAASFALSDVTVTDEQALRHGQVLAGVKSREEVLAEMLAAVARPRGRPCRLTELIFLGVVFKHLQAQRSGQECRKVRLDPFFWTPFFGLDPFFCDPGFLTPAFLTSAFFLAAHTPIMN